MVFKKSAKNKLKIFILSTAILNLFDHLIDKIFFNQGSGKKGF